MTLCTFCSAHCHAKPRMALATAGVWKLTKNLESVDLLVQAAILLRLAAWTNKWTLCEKQKPKFAKYKLMESITT